MEHYDGGSAVTENVREHLDRILASYDDIDGRFSGVGGVAKLLGLFEDIKRQLDRVSEQELERVTGEIKQVVEGLLKVDYELRKVQNLKLLFEQGGAADLGSLGASSDASSPSGGSGSAGSGSASENSD